MDGATAETFLLRPIDAFALCVRLSISVLFNSLGLCLSLSVSLSLRARVRLRVRVRVRVVYTYWLSQLLPELHLRGQCHRLVLCFSVP